MRWKHTHLLIRIVPPPNIYAYKCQIISIACCDVMTSQHVSLILSDGDQNDLARQQPRVHIQLGESECTKHM